MKKIIFSIFILFISHNIFAQNGWNEVWSLQEIPFQDPTGNSDFARVLAGFDTDEDGWGEFLTGYTDYDSNYIFLYEATGDNSYEMVWHYKFPYKSDSRYAAAVSDIDNNGKVEIIVGWASLVDSDNPNPPRIFTFEWNGIVGENNYGRDNGDGTFNPTHQSKMELPDDTQWNPYSMVVEDIDKDGKDELILGIRSGGRGREVLIASVTGGDLSGFGRFQIEYNFQNEESGSNYCTTVGDLDNDGLTDIVEVVWWKLTLRMFEATGPNTYEHVNDLDQIYSSQDIDYGSVDGARILDINGDGKNEFVMAAADDAAVDNELFIIQNVTDISAITAADVVSFYTFPKTLRPNGLPLYSGLRSMDVGDPDHDGKISLLICGGENGLIYDLEYKGEGDL
ncbi:MAG: VCBS repeat-containing protein, partial [Ignavibacteriae bacterium]|nr:VCBS repeat-containing protein [Ignavibacteriota bacterium]